MRASGWAISALVLTSVAILPSSATADGVDEEFNVGGVDVRVEGSVTELGPAPSTPVDDVAAGQDPVSLDGQVGQVDPQKICTLDDATVSPVVGFDVLPCRITDYVDVASPCSTVFHHVADVPHVGSGAVAAVEEATTLADAAVAETLANPPSELPSDVRDPITTLVWGERSHDLVLECSTDAQPARSVAATNASEILLDVLIDIDVCPYPELIPYCEPFSARNTTTQTVDGAKLPLATNPCTVENLRADCGNVRVDGVGDFNPLAPTHQLLDQAEPSANATYDTDNHLGIITPGTDGWLFHAGTGSPACIVGGLPPNSGVLPGAWSALAEVGYQGATLPLELQDVLAARLAEVSAFVNANLAFLSAQWSATLNGAIASANAAWDHPFLDANVHPADNGHPSHTNCGATTTPDAGVEPLPAPPAPPEVPDPEEVLP